MKRPFLDVLALAGALLAPSIAMADTFTLWARDTTEPWMVPLVEKYNASHDDKIELQIIPGIEMVQKYATAAAGGAAPDVLSMDLIYVPSFAQQGQLEDITDLILSFDFHESFAPAHLNMGLLGGRNYALPFYVDGSLLFWNKDLFREAGLDPEHAPANWQELKDYSSKITALGGDKKGYYFPGNCPGCEVFTFSPYVWASGGDILSADGKTALIDQPVFREAIDLYRSMWQAGEIPAGAQTDTGANFITGFSNGNVGMAPIGTFAIKPLKDTAKFEFGVGLIPGKDGGNSSFVGGDNLVVTKGRTDKLPAVKRFLEWTFSLEQQTMLASYGNLPVRSDIAEEALKLVDPRYTTAAQAISIGKVPYTVVFNDLFNSTTGPWGQLLSNAIFGDDVEGALATGQAEMQTIIDSAQ